MSEKELKCPKDGGLLQLMYESEKLSKLVKISIYYKCVTCGFRKDIERVELQRVEQGISVKRFLYSPRS
ncbi:MAG: hypothetical protein QXE81_05675 [Desulfurococcaceae archaeon]